MYNYFNFKPAGDQILLTNDFGRYVFLSKAEFQQFLQNELLPDSPLYKLLEERFFLYSNHPETFLKRTREPMRYSKNYLFSGTALHIFVVTNRCNGNCVYCQAHAADSNSHGDMTLEVAEHAVDIALSSPARHLTFEFQGGEPLLNFKVIQHIVLYTEANKGNKDVSFSVVSNLTLLTDDIMSFLMEHKVSISTSLDGPEFLHNQNRPLLNGQGCYAKTIDKVQKLRNAGTSVNAIQTTTKASLAYPKKIVDAYSDNGFKSIFLRPLTPLGYAACHWDEIGYTAEEFVSFYHDAFLYILERNREGVLFVESHAAIFLRKILYGFGENYMELR